MLAALFALLNLVGAVVVGALGLGDDVNRAMGGVNTSDPIDGAFGLAAVVLVLVLVSGIVGGLTARRGRPSSRSRTSSAASSSRR